MALGHMTVSNVWARTPQWITAIKETKSLCLHYALKEIPSTSQVFTDDTGIWKKINMSVNTSAKLSCECRAKICLSLLCCRPNLEEAAAAILMHESGFCHIRLHSFQLNDANLHSRESWLVPAEERTRQASSTLRLMAGQISREETLSQPLVLCC